MRYMDHIRKLFRKINYLLSASSRELQPRDMLSKIISEMESRKKLGIDENAFVPNVYALSLCPDDYEELSPLLNGIEEQLVNKIMEKIKKKGYKILSTSINLEIRDDSALKKNEVVVESSFLKQRTSSECPPVVSDEEEACTHSEEKMSASPQAANDDVILLPHTTKIVEDKKTRIIENSQATIEILSGESRGDVVHLKEGEYTFGRGKDAVILIRDSDGTVSRVHFKITVKDGRVSIKDLESANGTKVNDIEIDEAEIKAGDRIEAGRAVLKVV